MGTRDELLVAVAARYRGATRGEKGRILFEFAEITGYRRKHAERLLRKEPVAKRSRLRPERRIYDQAVREALVVLWEASDRICGKRLKPLIPVLIPAKVGAQWRMTRSSDISFIPRKEMDFLFDAVRYSRQSSFL